MVGPFRPTVLDGIEYRDHDGRFDSTGGADALVLAQPVGCLVQGLTTDPGGR
jgi:hypothetical protein